MLAAHDTKIVILVILIDCDGHRQRSGQEPRTQKHTQCAYICVSTLEMQQA